MSIFSGISFQNKTYDQKRMRYSKLCPKIAYFQNVRTIRMSDDAWATTHGRRRMDNDAWTMDDRL